VREASRQFAQRLLAPSARSLDEAVRLGYVVALSRQPTEEELTNSVQFLQRQTRSYVSPGTSAESTSGLLPALEDFCQVLFCLNEFIYLE